MDYGEIKRLAKERGCSTRALLALAPNNDPFYVGMPAQIEKARWFATLWERFGFGSGVHLRRIHYVLQAQEPAIALPGPITWANKATGARSETAVYVNNDACWSWLGAAAKYARYLALVPAGVFVDRRNPPVIECATWGDPAWSDYEPPSPQHSVEESWEPWGYDLPTMPERPSLPWYVSSGYNVEQEIHVEIWAEKSTMNDVLVPLCERYNVNLVTGLGELSITTVLRFLERARASRRPARVLYVSDYDPAGLGMPVSVARKIEFWQRNRGDGDLDIQLEPVVLTVAQIREYGLPGAPVKESDKRKARFEREHGLAVELDALEALHPGALARIIEDALGQYRDDTLEERAGAAKEEYENELAEARARVLGDLGPEIDAVMGDFDDLAVILQGGFQATLDAHQDQIDALRESVQALSGLAYERLAGEPVEASPVPVAHLPAVRDDLLYDSRRGYDDQLRAYQIHQGLVWA